MVDDAPPTALLRLFQAEWCPASQRVRQRLTELDVSYMVLQVPVERDQREGLVAATGARSIPALVTEDDAAIIGEPGILAYLGRRFDEPVGALAHRLKAERAPRRQLEEASA